ncbi:hypothetical protein GCM10023176_07700 [Micromonospora coerulea]|uniref:Uncharacterized protein n=1 Tax=Micromonospora coerulea TaxID=47856 RepID=A0ABP8S973_9ACTN
MSMESMSFAFHCAAVQSRESAKFAVAVTGGAALWSAIAAPSIATWRAFATLVGATAGRLNQNFRRARPRLAGMCRDMSICSSISGTASVKLAELAGETS